MSLEEHKKNAIGNIRFGVIVVSTTRSLDTDQSGKWIFEQAKNEGYITVLYEVIKDNEYEIKEKVIKSIKNKGIDVLLLTGGTGLSINDVTIEAVNPLFTKLMPGFGYIFSYLSYKQINSAAIISRATAGVINNTAVFCIPGSKKACELACKKIIFPELGHIMSHIL